MCPLALPANATTQLTIRLKGGSTDSASAPIVAIRGRSTSQPVQRNPSKNE